jgi:hypothetical protein
MAVKKYHFQNISARALVHDMHTTFIPSGKWLFDKTNLKTLNGVCLAFRGSLFQANSFKTG